MKVLVALTLIAVATAADLQWKACDSSKTKITKVFSDDCADAVCKLHKGGHKIQLIGDLI